MQERQLGCKTLGCGAAILIVLVTFWGMLGATDELAKKAKARKAARSGQSAATNLQALGFAVASYTAANAGNLPPTESAKVFRQALSPRFLSDVSVLSDVSGMPFSPNPNVSGKPTKAVGTGAMLLSSEPDAANSRTILTVGGQVQTLGLMDFERLAAQTFTVASPSPMPKQTLLPAPVAPKVPVPSPAKSPR